MKAAIVQSEIKFEDKFFNLKRAYEFIQNAANSGADIIFFPEMSFTGFSMNTRLTGETDGYTISLMRTAAEKHNIAIGFGFVRLLDGKGENHYLIADKEGNIVSDYTKIHSFTIGGERGDFRSGNTLPSAASICGMNISTFICYDLRFPEIFRAVTDRTDIVAVAANWPASRRNHWRTLLKARAIENQVYIIGINCTGTQKDIYYSGDSMVIDPMGNVLAEAVPGTEQLLLCDISDNVSQVRRDFPVLESRKFDLYGTFYL
ncbi:MAG: nitrilase-related carbon-nitrogen hydrolase [bacterium]|nr:nitrilase-related carbon-nitrogen hydrolase [bacterium]